MKDGIPNRGGKRWRVWLLGCCGLMLATCLARDLWLTRENHAQAADRQPAVGTLAVEGYRKIELQSGTQVLHLWNVQVSRLQRMTATLHVMRDGKSVEANKIEYSWKEWNDPTPIVAGQLLLSLTNGKLFGADDKTLPLLALDFVKPGTSAKTKLDRHTMLEGPLRSATTLVTSEVPRISLTSHKDKAAVLYVEVLLPQDDQGATPVTEDLDQLIKSADNGRVAIAVTLEGEPL